MCISSAWQMTLNHPVSFKLYFRVIIFFRFPACFSIIDERGPGFLGFSLVQHTVWKEDRGRSSWKKQQIESWKEAKIFPEQSFTSPLPFCSICSDVNKNLPFARVCYMLSFSAVGYASNSFKCAGEKLMQKSELTCDVTYIHMKTGNIVQKVSTL